MTAPTIARLQLKYPATVPVIFRQSAGSLLPELVKRRFLVPNTFTVAQLLHLLRLRLGTELSPSKAILLIVGNAVPASTQLVSALYAEHRDATGCLYVDYTGESTFGMAGARLPLAGCAADSGGLASVELTLAASVLPPPPRH
jgi:GABA(A) receptor-associated protein